MRILKAKRGEKIMNALTRLIKPRLIAPITLMLLVITGINLIPAAHAQSKDEEAVRSALLQNATGFERNDLGALNKVWANDESVTVFESGHANYGWADYRDNHLVPEMAEFKNTKYTLTDIKARVDGKTAWATFKYSISADFKDRHVEGSGLGTAVLEKRDGRWQIVHWHTSSAPRRPAGSEKKQ